MKVGIVGLGSFGKLIAQLAPKNVELVSYDINGGSIEGVKKVALAELAHADVIFLAIPLQAYASFLTKLEPVIRPETLLVDVCSVKVRPAQLIAKYLSGHQNVLLTHPLFGPQSVAPGKTAGRELIVTKSNGEKAQKLLNYCQKELKLTIRHATNEDHDKAMAQVHALTFFVAHGLSRANVGDGVPYVTPSFGSLLELVKLDKTHTESLFNTIQLGNPYAQEARETLIENFKLVEKELRTKGQL